RFNNGWLLLLAQTGGLGAFAGVAIRPGLGNVRWNLVWCHDLIIGKCQLAGTTETLLWLFCHGSADHLIQFRRKIVTPSFERWHFCIEMLFRNGLSRLAAKGRLPGEHTIQHCA